MKKVTIFLAIGALVLFMGGCGSSTGTDGDVITLPQDTASVSETASTDPAVTEPTDAPADTEPTDSSATQEVQPTDTATDPSADATQDVEPSDDASADPDQPADTSDDSSDDSTDDSSDDSDQPQDEDSPAPTKTAKPSATPSADASSGDESSGKALSAGKVTGAAQVSDYLSLRSSASTTAEVVAKIKKDDKFTITGVNKDSAWLKVEYSGKSGYVLAKYVEVNGSDEDKVCMVTSSGSLNVRDGAGTTHELLGTVKSGTTLVVTEVVKASPDNWYKVTLSGTTGYVSAKYCRIGS